MNCLKLSKLKEYMREIGKPSIIHTDNGGEFTSKIFELFLKENKMVHIKGGVSSLKVNAMQKFNDTIITKISYIKLDEEFNFNIEKALKKVVNAYNVIKIELTKALLFNRKR